MVGRLPRSQKSRSQKARSQKARSEKQRSPTPSRIGVLALQGSVEPHCASLSRLDVDAVEIRQPQELEGIRHLVFPGGESTTLYKLLRFYDMWEPIGQRLRDGTLAAFGTCAGAILLGQGAEDPPRWEALDVTVNRNAYGRQVDSFIAPLEAEPDGPLAGQALEGVFIRAPKFDRLGNRVQVLARHEGLPVVLQEGRLLVAACHPELTSNLALHRHFLTL